MAESEELRRFREEWMREVSSRHQPEPIVEEAAGSKGAEAGVAAKVGDPASSPTASTFSDVPDASQSSPTATPISFIGPGSPTSRQSALHLYTQAVALEAQGKLDAATSLYRRAFRLDAHVDRTYQRVGNERDINVGLVEGIGALSLGQRMLNGRYTLKGPTSTSNETSYEGHRASSGALRAILSSFPPISQLSFLPEDESQPVPINKLPDELIVLILHQFVANVDTRSIERFGTTSRRARVVTLDRGLWRDLVQLIYVPPQLEYSPLVLLPTYKDDFRQLYIGQPRVRLDGVYIAVCHYIRTGHSDNAWVNITHLITYHRYLRFLPNGVVISLLSSDSTASPQEIIPRLRLDAHGLKGLSIGQWRLDTGLTRTKDKRAPLDDFDGPHHEDGPIVIIEDLLDTTWTAPTQSHALHGSGTQQNSAPTGPKYSFSMRLGLRSRPLGRWNKLDMLEYNSVSVASGEATPLPLKHERPYWFSKVRSYGSGLV
ncbi:hypothetical protein CPB86DRAFT_387149 [Serendipita vermifera]|nr:hypothetical protein CPB86DRAFT_387149 [Serendipita vermifera]